MNEKNSPIHLNLRTLGAAIVYRWPVVLLPTIVLPILVWGLVKELPKEYKVSAQILVQESISVNPFLEDMSVPWTVRERLPVIQAIIISRATLEKALKHLGELTGKEPPMELDDKIRLMRSQISVYGMGGGLIAIDFVGSSPERLYKGLVYLVDVLVEAMLRPQKQSLEDASRFLDKQIKETKATLVKLEKDIEKFKKEHVEELPEVFQANLQSYMTNQTTLLDRQTELRAARMRKQNLEQRLRVYNPVARGLESNLIEAKTKLSQLKSVYTDEHPEIRALEAHIAQLKKERKAANLDEKGDINISALESAAKMRTVVAPGTRRMDSRSGTSSTGSTVEGRTDDLFTSDLLDYKAVSAEVSALEGSVNELNKHGRETLDSVKSFATTERFLQSLLRDFEVKQNTYTSLLARADEAKVTKALSMFDEDQQIVLIESPRMPTSPIGFTSHLNTVVGLIAGLLLGITIVILVEFASDAVRNKGEIERLIGMQIVGTLPLLSGDSKKTLPQYLLQEKNKT
jgi:polysaccharide chain length determinant protein (PEP-CTERM system associated)